MKKLLFAATFFLFIFTVFFVFFDFFNSSRLVTGAPPYDVFDIPPSEDTKEFDYLKDWVRPAGPARVALQVGHWKSNELPDELQRIRGNTGASGGGKAEWEVNYEIAMLAKDILEENGVLVEILPATVPKEYWADVFISIHADGSLDPQKSGFKAATPRRDMTGKANSLLEAVETSYEKTTGLLKDPIVTRNMRGYYAFSYWRYDHAVHPMTTSLILETGFLSSPSDRKIIVDEPELASKGLTQGIISYLQAEELVGKTP
jgi:hypothetical protein